MPIHTQYRIMSVGWSTGHPVKTSFPNIKIPMKMQIFMMILRIMMIMMMVQESVKMCLNVLIRPVSALYYKIISIYTTIDTPLNLLTGLFPSKDKRWSFLLN